MSTLPFLSSATGDSILMKRRIAPQATRGVPATSGFVDFRSNGGPLAITRGEITRRVINASSAPGRNLPGKLTIGNGPLDMGDVDPADLGLNLILANLFKHYDLASQASATYYQYLHSPVGATAADPYLTLLNDNDVNPRHRLSDVVAGSMTITASPNQNLAITFNLQPGHHDFHGIVTQAEGGTSGTLDSVTRSSTTATATYVGVIAASTGDTIRIAGAVQTAYNGDQTATVVFGGGTSKSVTSITRVSTTATVTTATAHGWTSGNLVRFAGAVQTEYNGDFTVTVTSPTVATYTVSGTPATPATGTITAQALARFTYAVAGSPATPATGTVTFELLNSSIPVLTHTWDGNWSEDDETISIKVTDITDIAATIPSVSVVTKVGSGSYGSTDQVILLGEHNRLYDDTYAATYATLNSSRFGKLAEQVHLYWPTSPTLRVNDEFSVPQNRAAWSQSLSAEYPISSINTSFILGDSDGNTSEVRVEGGWSLTVEWENTEAVPDTAGAQGYVVQRRGKLTAKLELTRRVVDLTLQRLIHQADTASVVMEAFTDSDIPGATVPYRFAFALPLLTSAGTLFDTEAGGTNLDEKVTFTAADPDTDLTYNGVTYSGHVNVLVESENATLAG